MTLAATITPTGISAPDYNEILTELQNAYYAIYGSDAYLAADSQDGQLLAVFAQAINDCNQLAIAIYNAYSPANAQGAGLSSLVKINGLRREAATNSTAIVAVGGTSGTQINNGIIGDNQNLGTKWTLPAVVVIPNSGTINVTATCATPGAVTAAPNTLQVILTPTRGWQSVNNAGNASPGQPVEQDSTLRQRQAASTDLPAQSPFDAVVANVGNVNGVTRYKGYENDTGSADANGIPAHSISLVVQGGAIQDIVNAIGVKKNAGTPTYGTTTGTYTDPEGIVKNINFYVLANVTITVVVTLRTLTGWAASTAALIQAAIAQYINSLMIGEYCFVNRLFGPANLSGDAATTATGLTQAALDLLSATYNLISIAISRVAPPVETTVTNGPRNAGATTANVANATNIYQGQTIEFILDNAATFQTVVSNVAYGVAPAATLTFAPAVPGGRNIPNNSNVYLITDVGIVFNEAAVNVVANTTVNTA